MAILWLVCSFALSGRLFACAHNFGALGCIVGLRHALRPRPPTDPPQMTDIDSAQTRLHLHMPVDVRSVSLGILATLASLWALHVASAVFIPFLLGLMVSYALSPVVDRMASLHIPRAVGAALLLGAIGLGAGWTVYTLSDDATALIESLPGATQKVRDAVRAQRGQSESAINKVQRAATQLETAAQDGAAAPLAVSRGVTRVSIERPRFDIKDYLWSGTLGVAESIGQGFVVVFIAFFLLASGNSFRRKMVKIAGPSFAQKRITVEVLDEITQQIHQYLFVQVFTSVLVGLVTWLAFWLIGLQHAAVWGVLAFVLNFIPYVGSIAIAGGAALVAFVQFGNLNTPLLVAGVALGIHTLSGNLLTPWLTSRTSRINAVVVFVGVLAFGWLWGAWGLLLGVPLLTTIKAVCDRIDDLKPIGELLGA
jgi:predicted PurR-regulated permease PerM